MCSYTFVCSIFHICYIWWWEVVQFLMIVFWIGIYQQVIHKKYRISYDDIALDLCPVSPLYSRIDGYNVHAWEFASEFDCSILQILSVQQLYRICTLYWDDSYNTRSVSQDVSFYEKTALSISFSRSKRSYALALIMFMNRWFQAWECLW